MPFIRIVDDEIPCFKFVEEYAHNVKTGEQVALGYQEGDYEISYDLMARYTIIMKDFEQLQDELWEAYYYEP